MCHKLTLRPRFPLGPGPPALPRSPGPPWVGKNRKCSSKSAQVLRSQRHCLEKEHLVHGLHHTLGPG